MREYVLAAIAVLGVVLAPLLTAVFNARTSARARSEIMTHLDIRDRFERASDRWEQIDAIVEHEIKEWYRDAFPPAPREFRRISLTYSIYYGLLSLGALLFNAKSALAWTGSVAAGLFVLSLVLRVVQSKTEK